MYVELTCKSNFSFLRGACDSRDYIQRAIALGMSAVGVCDINGVYGLPRAFEAIRDHAPNLKLLCGAQVTVQDHPPIHLIVKTRAGWGLLCRLLTQVHADKEKGQGFITLEEVDFLLRRFPGREDLIAIAQNDEKNNFAKLQELFGKNLYLSLCKYQDGLDGRRVRLAETLSRLHHLPVVATNDVHYHIPERQFLQDILSCIREGTTLDRAGFKLFGNSERYLKSPLQMAALFSEMPEAIANTAQIANQCTFSLRELKYSYPKETVPSGLSAKEYLYKLALDGAKHRYKNGFSAEAHAQLKKELDFFSKRSEEDYFLTMYDILQYARSQKIVHQGRGSAASSILCYLLGITAVDPIACNLLFDRFANDARPDPPDIDVDFEHERREEVIQEIYRRFGRTRAGMVAAVHTYQARNSYREVCKALGVEVGTLKADEVRSRFQELAKQYSYREIFLEHLRSEIAQFPRHLAIHSGGFVITNDPLIETVPIEPAAMDGRTIVQWDKHDLETLGMMKIDILSIGFLTVIRKTCDLLHRNWADIPVNDEKTYKLIRRAETAGCFQIESRAQMSSLPHTQPETPYEMTIQVALIRPSMSVGGMTRAYLRGRAAAKRGVRFTSGNVAMDNILGRTHGVAMFPDQIMQIAMDVCGFSSVEADQLRRSLGQERSAATVDVQGQKLFTALLKNGIRENLASDIMKRTQGFASYGFPEAHAASYGRLAFMSAFLKTHHPAELLCSLINSQPMGFYNIDFLINEAKRNSGIRVLPILPHVSDWDAKMEGDKIVRMGFRNVRKINQADVEHMVQERARAPFKSIEDFISRTHFPRAVIRTLAIANVFECFGIDRRHSFWQSLEYKALVGEKASAQLSLIDENFRLNEVETTFSPMSEIDMANIDYRSQGYSLNGNLMKHLRLELPHLPQLNSRKIKATRAGAIVDIAGILLVDQRPPPAKGFGFITLEDEFGTIDLVLRPAVYDGFKPVFRSSRFLLVRGKVQRMNDQITLLPDSLESFAPVDKVRSHQPHPRMLDTLVWR